MSQQNVEFVYRAYAAIHRQDLDSHVTLHDSGCQVFPRIVSIEGGAPYRGHEGYPHFGATYKRRSRTGLPDPGEVRDLGDAVIAKVHFRARGSDSGVMIDQLIWQAVKFYDGRITWWAIYPREADALEALGLSE